MEIAGITNIDRLKRSCRPPIKTIAVEMKICRCSNGVSLITFDYFDADNTLGIIGLYSPSMRTPTFWVNIGGIAVRAFQAIAASAQRALCAPFLLLFSLRCRTLADALELLFCPTPQVGVGQGGVQEEPPLATPQGRPRPWPFNVGGATDVL